MLADSAETDAEDEDEDGSSDNAEPASLSIGGEMPVIRPGIVHRLDKGTTGAG